MEHATPRNDANLDARPNDGAQAHPDAAINPGQEFEGSRPGKKTAALVVIVLAAYVVIDHWPEISAAFG